MDDRTLLVAIGEALYGHHWQTSLSAKLDVSERTMRRWIASGEVPTGVWRDLVVSLADRREVINSLMKEVRDRS